MRRSAAALAAILALAIMSAGGWNASLASAQESFSGWRGGPIREGSGFRFPDGSDRVREVQRHLRTLGYALNGEDGKFGPQTDQAVRRFQGREGLTPNGIVGVRTIRELRAEVAALERRRARESRTGSGSGGASTPGAASEPAPAPQGGAARRGKEPAAGARRPRPLRGSRAEETAGAGVVLGLALALAAVVAGAALLVGRRLRGRGRGSDAHDPSEGLTAQALSERIAVMRASGLSPQAVAERVRAERRGEDV